MTSLLDLLNAPAGTIATTVVDGTPTTIAIINTAGVHRLAVQDSDAIIGPTQLADRIHSGRTASPAVKQLHPTPAGLLPERPYIENDDDAQFAWRREYDILDALPVGTVIDATPEGGTMLDIGGPGDAVLLTRISREGWAGLHSVAPQVDTVRDVLSGDASRFPNAATTAWVLALVGDCVLAEFTILPALAPWGAQSPEFPRLAPWGARPPRPEVARSVEA